MSPAMSADIHLQRHHSKRDPNCHIMEIKHKLGTEKRTRQDPLSPLAEHYEADSERENTPQRLHHNSSCENLPMYVNALDNNLYSI